MKKNIHPNYHKIKVVMTDGSEFSETQGAVSFISLLMKFVTGKDE